MNLGVYHLLEFFVITWEGWVLNLFENLVYFCFHCFFYFYFFFGIRFKKIIAKTHVEKHIFYVLFSSFFFVPGFTFKFLIHVQLIFGHGVDSGVVSLFCMWPSNFLNTICWRDCPFPYISLAPLLYINWPYMHEFIPGLSFWFHWGIRLIFLPKLYCLDYYSFVIYFEIRKCDTSHFVFLSPFCFGSLGSVLVSYKF